MSATTLHPFARMIDTWRDKWERIVYVATDDDGNVHYRTGDAGRWTRVHPCAVEPVEAPVSGWTAADYYVARCQANFGWPVEFYDAVTGAYFEREIVSEVLP